MNSSQSPYDGLVSDEDQSGNGALYKDNLIYLPFARHLAEVDEAEESGLKAA